MAEMSDVRILHVDDDPDFAAMTVELLERRDGFAVETAGSASEGLAQLSEGAYDCIVSDYDMPGMDGIEFLDAVRDDFPDLPFVLFTGKGSETVASDAISAGATDYIQKGGDPSRFELLANRITNAVESYRASQRAARIEEEHRLVAEMSTDVFYVVDMETGDVRYSDGIERFGYDPEMVDRDIEWWQARVHPADREQIVASHAATREPTEEGFAEFTGDRGFVENEYRWRRADGTYAHLVGRGVTLFEDGQAVKQVGTMEEITDRKAREQRARRLQTVTAKLMRAETVQDVADLAVEAAEDVFSLPLSGIHLRSDEGAALEAVAVTDAVRETFGEPPTYERDGDTRSSVVWDAFEAGERRIWDDIEETAELPSASPIRSLVVQPLADHGVFLLSSPTPDAVGGTDLAFVDILATTVTAALDRIEREQRLQAERERFRSLFELIPEPVCIIEFEEGEPILQDVNLAFEETFTDGTGAIVGQSCNEVVVPPEQEDEAERIDEQALTGESVSREVRREAVDGVRDFLFRSVPVDTGETYFGVYVDISEQKESKRRLERQNERLDQFASVVSHDLRNPLNVASGRLSLARAECDSEYLDDVARAHDRIEDLIDDLLTLAREGKQVTELEPISLAEAVERCWRTVETADATLVTDTDQTIEADPKRLHQVFENLFRNAVEHAGEDVTVRVGDLIDSDGFYVADDGPGISVTEHGQVFEAGYSTADSGTGFGLNIVSDIVDAHGWSIRLTDSESGGARFEITDVDIVE